MSSSALPQSANVSMLRELLAAEKEDTRVWFRAEMDRLVDPLLDTLFYKLETKLTNGLERTHSGVAGHGAHCTAQAGNPSFVYQSANVPQSATLTTQPSSSSTLTASLISPLSYFHPHHDNVNYSHPIPLDALSTRRSSPTSPVPPPPVSIIPQITLANQLTSGQSRPMPNKHPIEPTANEPMAEDQSARSLSALIVNEQPNDNLANWDEDDEEGCECDECMCGIELEEDDDSDSVQRIGDEQELPPPTKKPKIGQTRPNNAQPEVIGQSPRQPTIELQFKGQPNQVNKQFITVYLQCPQSNCLATFPEEQLNQHMREKHLLGPSRCLVKDCGQSFDNSYVLRDHIKQAHHNTSRWHCGKCSKHFTAYKLLHKHNTEQHQFGYFLCSFPSCPFTGEHRNKMYSHYKQHKH